MNKVKKVKIDIAEARAAELEATGNYKVLRMLPPPPVAQRVDGVKTYKGIYTDCETTGLDTDKDEIIELGAVPFTFDHDGRLVEVGAPLQTYNEPANPITEEITKLTGISADTVRGCTIGPEFDAAFASVDLVVAHNAGFDRKMVERYCPSTVRKCWACSQRDVPWKENGVRATRLEYILMDRGFFYKAHGAIPDCMAALYALASPLGNRTGFAYLLDAARKIEWHVYANNAKYDAKDLLKERKYKWHTGSDNRSKVWHKVVDDKEAELLWLAQAVYKSMVNPAEVERVTAFDRYSKRTEVV